MEEKKSPGPTPETPVPQQTEVFFNDKNMHAAYANFARVTATPEEVIMDFALNPNPFATGRQDINIDQRLIMNFFTAKRLFTTLGMTLQKHEEGFGPIELDIRRRARGIPGGPPTTPK